MALKFSPPDDSRQALQLEQSEQSQWLEDGSDDDQMEAEWGADPMVAAERRESIVGHNHFGKRIQ